MHIYCCGPANKDTGSSGHSPLTQAAACDGGDSRAATHRCRVRGPRVPPRAGRRGGGRGSPRWWLPFLFESPNFHFAEMQPGIIIASGLKGGYWKPLCDVRSSTPAGHSQRDGHWSTHINTLTHIHQSVHSTEKTNTCIVSPAHLSPVCIQSNVYPVQCMYEIWLFDSMLS